MISLSDVCSVARSAPFNDRPDLLLQGRAVVKRRSGDASLGGEVWRDGGLGPLLLANLHDDYIKVPHTWLTAAKVARFFADLVATYPPVGWRLEETETQGGAKFARLLETLARKARDDAAFKAFPLVANSCLAFLPQRPAALTACNGGPHSYLTERQ